MEPAACMASLITGGSEPVEAQGAAEGHGANGLPLQAPAEVYAEVMHARSITVERKAACMLAVGSFF